MCRPRVAGSKGRDRQRIADAHSRNFSGTHSHARPKAAVCQECVELRLGVPGMCQGQAGLGLGKRCK